MDMRAEQRDTEPRDAEPRDTEPRDADARTGSGHAADRRNGEAATGRPESVRPDTVRPDAATPYAELPESLRVAAGRGLTDEEVALLRPYAEEVRREAGDHLFTAGEGTYEFWVMLEGRARIVDPTEGGDGVVNTVEPTGFLGEIGMLTGQTAFLSCIVSEPSVLLRVPVDKVRRIIAEVPELGDRVITAFAARREVLMRSATANLTIVGPEDSGRTTALREFAARNRIPHRWLDPEEDAGAALVARHDLDPGEPSVILLGKTVLRGPTKLEVAVALGMNLETRQEHPVDLLIVGAGPGGLAAAVYGASEGLKTVVLDDTAIGGQAGTSSRIENYMGFPTGVSGGELAYRGQVQAIKFGACFATPHRAVSFTPEEGCYRVGLESGSSYRARALVLACGVQYRKLPLDRLADFEGAGIYYAATDLEARFCAGTQAVIVGGGNSAGQAAMFLSRHARHVHIMVRGDGLADTMSDYLLRRLEADERITIHTRTQVKALHGGTHLERVELSTGESIDTRALFVMIGAAPFTDWLGDRVELDEKGFVKTGASVGRENQFETSCPGVFAVGDVRSGSVKRVASAVGEGSVVVSAVHARLAAMESEADAGTARAA